MAKDEILDRFIQGITALIHPEVIICYGIRTRTFEACSCFLENKKTHIARIYDLLIVTRENKKNRAHEILDIIENYNTPVFAITAVIHSIHAVEEALKKGNFFFTCTCHEGILLYNANGISLNIPVVETDNTDRALTIEAQWDKWFGLAKRFSKGASYYLSNGWYDMAVFMLHQAVEHTAIALIRIHMGYRPATHSLKRLLALIENFAPFSFDVFPQTSKEEVELFNTLTKAYSDVRYKEVYRISEEKVNILLDRVNDLQNLSEGLFEKLLKAENSVPHIVSSFKN